MKSYGEWRAPPSVDLAFDAGFPDTSRKTGDEGTILVSKPGVYDSPCSVYEFHFEG
jgi:hypothetical protein